MKKPFIFCPECESDELEFYDTAPDEKSGRYRCDSCGRNTIWKTPIVISAKELIDMLEAHVGDPNDQKDS